METSSNASLKSPNAGPALDNFETVKLYTFWTCTGLGVLLNLGIILMIVCYRKYRRPTNSLVAYLAGSSIFAMLWTAMQPYEALKGAEWFEIPYFCEFTTFIRRVPQPAMAFTTVAIVLDRKRFTRNLLARPSAWHYVKIILLITALAALLAAPRFFERTYDPNFEHASRNKCKKVLIAGSEWLTIAYNVTHFCCTYLGPAAVLLKQIWVSRATIRCLFSSTVNFLFFCTKYRDRHFVLGDKRAQLVVTVSLFSVGFLLFWPQHGLFYLAVNLLGPGTGTTSARIKSQVERGWYYSRALYYAYTSTNPTLLLVLCYDWQWTTVIQLTRK